MWSETCVRHCLTADTKPKPETIKHIFKNGSRVVDLPSKTTIYRIWMYVYIYTVYSNIYIYVYIFLHAYKYTVCVYIIIYIYICMCVCTSLPLSLSLSIAFSICIYFFWCMRIYAYSMCLYVHSKYLAIDSAICYFAHWLPSNLWQGLARAAGNHRGNKEVHWPIGGKATRLRGCGTKGTKGFEMVFICFHVSMFRDSAIWLLNSARIALLLSRTLMGQPVSE